MPGWKMQATKRIVMPEDLADGLWLEIHHPRRLPLEAVKQYHALSKLSADSDAGFIDGAAQFVSSLITDWNFPDESAQGTILKLPSQDPDVWRKVPVLEVVNVIFGELQKGTEAMNPDPNSSAGSAKP